MALHLLPVRHTRAQGLRGETTVSVFCVDWSSLAMVDRGLRRQHGATECTHGVHDQDACKAVPSRTTRRSRPHAPALPCVSSGAWPSHSRTPPARLEAHATHPLHAPLTRGGHQTSNHAARCSFMRYYLPGQCRAASQSERAYSECLTCRHGLPARSSLRWRRCPARLPATALARWCRTWCSWR